MAPDSFLTELMGRGLASDLAQRIVARFPDWPALSAANTELLAGCFSLDERDVIRRAKSRRAISRETVSRLIEECDFRCCLCWTIDSDSGVVIHHIRAHATVPDDRYENLVILCVDHHDQVHTSRELSRHPYPPEVLLRRKADFTAAIAAFKAGKRVAPGREEDAKLGIFAGPPLPPPHFVGRNTLVNDIANALDLPSGRAAIVGMGGVGKTALALKVADVFRAAFPSGSLWDEVASDGGGIAETLRSWIRSLGHDVSGVEIDEQFALLSSLLAERASKDGRLLLLLDDVGEHVVRELVKLISYVPPHVSVLVTTREATVGTAVGATIFRLDPLDRIDCRQLLEAVSGSALLQMEECAVDKLLSMLGDLPLAVELVGRQIALRERKPGFSISGLCRRLEDFDAEILSFPGHRGIAMSFALSYEHLDKNEQRLFRSLGSFASGPLHTTYIAFVAGADRDETEMMLDRFVAGSLLNWGIGESEYRIHPLLHKYSEFLLSHADAAEKISTQCRFYKCYTSIAVAAAAKTPDDLEAVDRILPQLIKAVQCAAAFGDHVVVCETVLGLSAGMSFFTSRSLDRESMPLLEMATAAAKHLGDRDVESAATGHLGSAFARLGMIGEAVAHYERAVAISRETGNDYDLASHLQNLGGTLLSEAKDLPKAERMLHEALQAAERSHNSDVVIGCLGTLGNLHRAVGNLAEAARLHRGSLEASRLARNRLSEGNNLSNLGLVMDQLGHAEEGERMIREALAIAVEIGDTRGEGNRTGHLGGILFRKATQLPPGTERANALKSSREQFSSAFRLAQETGDAEKAGTWLMNLGNIYAVEGDSAAGIDRYEEALCLAKARGFARLEAQVRFNLGVALAPLGQLQTALDHIRISRDLLRKMGSPLATEAEAYVDRLNRMLSK